MPRAFSADTPYEPCHGIVPMPSRASCYFVLPEWWLYVGKDFQTIGELCHALEIEGHREACFLGMGGALYSRTTTTERRAR